MPKGNYSTIWRSIARVPFKSLRRHDLFLIDVLQSLLDRVAFSLDHTPFKWVAIVSVLASAIVGLMYGRPWEATWAALAVAAAVWTVRAFLLWRAADKTKIALLDPQVLVATFQRARAQNTGASDRLVFKNFAIYDEAVNAHLDSHSVRLEMDSGVYELPKPVVLHRSRLRAGKKLRWDTTNDVKVRLVTDLLGVDFPRLSSVRCQPTDYFSNQLTNESGLICLLEPDGGDLVSPTSYWQGMNHNLVRLEESSAANVIGMSTLCIAIQDQEAFLISQLAGKQQTGAEQLAPASSGSLDIEDIEATRSVTGETLLQSILRWGMERELHEELGGDPARCQTRITGFARMLERGGKPEFYGLTISQQPSGAFREKERRVAKVYRDRVRLQAHDCAEDIERAVAALSERIRGPSALALAAKFGVDYLRRLPGTTDIRELAAGHDLLLAP